MNHFIFHIELDKQKFDGERGTLLFCVKREAENLRLSP